MDLSHVPARTCPVGCSEQKLSHKKWRAQIKKTKRKKRRQAEAAKKAEQSSPVDTLGETSDAEDEDVRGEHDRQLQHNLWLERERNAMAAIEAKKLWIEQEKKRIEEEQKQIKEEWEERQKLEKAEEDKRREVAAVKKKEQDKMLKEATANENSGEGEWHNPLAPPTGLVKERDPCPFFVKVGACRFGDRCSRFHDIPDSSKTVLIPNMYSHFQLDQGLFDEYDSDLVLEYEDSERYQHFKDFYRDTVPEFKTFGQVVQFKVCCNYEPHLRGNVYVQYEREQDAVNAAVKLNARWYGGKQMSCQFSNVSRWKNAICGLFHQKRCPKGKNCNFLHVFRNPGNEFRNADFDFEGFRNESVSRRSQGGYGERQRSRSRSPSVLSMDGRKRRRSRSRDGSTSRDRVFRRSSRSYSKEYSSRSYRNRSRSRSRSPGRRSRYTRSPSSKRNRRSRSRERERHSKQKADISQSKDDLTDSKPKQKSPKLLDNSSAAHNVLNQEGNQDTAVRDPAVSESNDVISLRDNTKSSNSHVEDPKVVDNDSAKRDGTTSTATVENQTCDNKTDTDDESEEALRAKLIAQISTPENGIEHQKKKHKKKHKKNKHKKHMPKVCDEISQDG